MSLNNIRIVLMNTSHPGNIGSAARAMLTMGLTDLYLVNPIHFPDEQANTMASGADSVLEKATVVTELQDAIADCHTVIGTSARDQRSIQWPLMDARECGEFVAARSSHSKIAIVFGRESSGLTNEELEQCQFLVSIPVNANFSSLNIASAVQVLSYECAVALKSHQQKRSYQQETQQSEKQPELVTTQGMDSFYQHLETTLIDLRYLDPEKPRLIMRKLRSIYGRMQLSAAELKLLRGILSAAQGRKFMPREQRHNNNLSSTQIK
ncbi:MAG: RNA methyltransferase [Thiotrichaceae bacterium]